MSRRLFFEVSPIEAVTQTVERAVQFFRDAREPHALLWLELMHRRFGIAAFAGSLQRFDQLLAEQPAQAPRHRVFRRIADPGTELRRDDLDAITHPSDEIIVSALYCDRLGLPPSFPAVLGKAVSSGGYYCTHALLAWIWLKEFGAALELAPGFVEDLFAANAAIVNEPVKTVTDLKLEAAAFLYLAGQGARVDAAFIDRVSNTQNADGGWGQVRGRPGVSDWHGTVLGLLLLLQAQQAAAG